MIIVSGTLQFDARQSAQVSPHITNVMRLTRKEKGCICYGFAHDMESDGLFHIYEEWESEDLLNAHLETQHIADFQKALSEFTILNKDIKILQAKVLRKL